MKKAPLLILIPCFNEAHSLLSLAEEVEAARAQLSMASEVLYINDHSTDHTKAELQRRGLPFLDLPINLGIGGAVQAGYRYAWQEGFTYVARIDGDGQHPPAEIEALIKTMEAEKAPVVVGSRFVEKKGFRSTISRRLGIKILSHWCFWLSGIRVLDITSGMTLINREALSLAAPHYPDTFPEPESVVLYGLHQLKVVEAPVNMRSRQTGASSITPGLSVFYMLKVLLGLFFITLKIRRYGRYSTA
jgi:glycosyltransferase involved in cell wall biosynthesis